MKQVRNQVVEAFRVVLIGGICLLHSIQFGGHCNDWIAESLKGCVVGFVFISGYYGVRFSFSKLVQLYLTGLYCAVVAISLHCLSGGETVSGYLKQIVITFYGYWFLHAYAVLLILVPFFNIVFDRVKEAPQNGNSKAILAMVIPFLFVFFVMAFLPSLPSVGKCFCRLWGFHIFSVMPLLGIYVAARCWRLFRLGERIKMRYAILAVVVLIPMINTFRLGSYFSPFLLALAALVFTLVLRVREQVALGWIGKAIGPSTFAIYLLHTNVFGYRCIKMLENILIGNCHLSVCIGWAITAGVVFFGAFLLDLPRRVMFNRRDFKSWIDAKFDRIIIKIEDWLR